MHSADTNTYFETVVQSGGRVEFIACDGDGDAVNRYHPLYVGSSDDFHLSFNLRDSELFIAFRNSEGDIGASVPMNAEELRFLAYKLLEVSLQITTVGGNA